VQNVVTLNTWKIMKTFYCEVEGEFRPYFRNSETQAKTAQEAMDFFKSKFGNRLQVVYDENFDMIFEQSKAS